MTQDQRGELSRSHISATVAAKAAKPADDSGDDDEDNDNKEVQCIGKKGDDGGDDKQGVKESLCFPFLNLYIFNLLTLNLYNLFPRARCHS